MTTEDLSRINPAAGAQLAQARSDYEKAGYGLADLEMAAAAHLVRNAIGADAMSVLIEKDTNDGGDTAMELLVVFDEHDQPIWVNTDNVPDYPGADEVSESALGALPTNLHWPIADHLERAYDLQSGAGHGLDVTTDDHFEGDPNLLLLDISAVLS